MKTKIMIAMIALFALPALLLTLAQSAPQLINFQGRLTNPAGQPLDGVTVDMTFSFYGAESGSTAYLSVLQPDVLVTAGIYNVLLGSGPITPGAESTLASVFQNHTDVWMGIKVDAEAEMVPRSRVGSVPYAMSTPGAVSIATIGDFLGKQDWDTDGFTKNGTPLDCNDAGPNIHPGAPELCDGVDNQCPGDFGYGFVDEGCHPERCHDYDEDGYYAELNCGTPVDCDDNDPNNFFSCSICSDNDADGFYAYCDDYLTINGPDCDDSNGTIYSEAEELCDGIDNNCPEDTGYAYVDEACWHDIGPNVRIDHFPDSIVWTGSEYGLIWSDTSNGNQQVYFSRMSSTGTSVGSDERISYTPENSSGSGLVWSGSEFGMTWSNNGSQFYFTRISSFGEKIGSDTALCDHCGGAPPPVWTGSEFAILFKEGNAWWVGGGIEWWRGTIKIIHLNSFGNIIDSLFLWSESSILNPSYLADPWSLSWTGEEFNVIIGGGAFSEQLEFPKLVKIPSGIGRILSISNWPNNTGLISWTGSEYAVVVYGNDNNLFFNRVSSDGSYIGGDERITSGSNYKSIQALNWNGQIYGISYLNGSMQPPWDLPLYFTTISADGAILSPNPFVINPNTCDSKMISTGSDFGIFFNVRYPDEPYCRPFFTRIGNGY